MSADLLAAFGVPQSDSGVARTPSNSKAAPATKETNTGASLEDQPWILQSQPIPKVQRQDQAQPLWKQDSKGADVLFDASDDDRDEDDFGDFEAAPVETRTEVQYASQPVQHANTDLLGLDDFSDIQNTNTSTPPSGFSYRDDTTADLFETKPSDQRNSSQKNRHQSQPHDGWHQRLSSSNQGDDHHHQQSQQESTSIEDEWGNFEDVEPAVDSYVTKTSTTKSQPTQSVETEDQADEDDWDAFEDVATTSVAMIAAPLSQIAVASLQSTPNPTPTPILQLANPPARPTNIPPPSNLLQLLPKVYTTLSQQSRQTNPTPDLPQHTLQIYATTAHLIAGRTHRWKRDTHLSQSTRISQAGLKNTGMKLAALDKSETIKEDQEAQEAISSWQRHAATLNAVMLKGKVQKPPMTLSANMAVRSANGLGVLTARECCAVCGLKRNERVTGIDVKVEDTFGEFWVEHWGHRDCCEFWYRYEGLLDKR